jgi:hypothetical protein
MNTHPFTADISIQSFLSKRFHWWKDCDSRFDPQDRTMYIFCEMNGLRGLVLRDSGKLSRINIGIDRFVVSRPGYQDLVIHSLARYNFSQFLANRG